MIIHSSQIRGEEERIMTNYPCNGCDAPITERDETILTGVLEGRQVYYHTQYPATVKDKNYWCRIRNVVYGRTSSLFNEV